MTISVISTPISNPPPIPAKLIKAGGDQSKNRNTNHILKKSVRNFHVMSTYKYNKNNKHKNRIIQLLFTPRRATTMPVPPRTDIKNPTLYTVITAK